MAHKQHRAALLGHIAHLAKAFLLKFGVAHRQDFIHNEDLGVEVGGHGEGQAHVHPARVALDGGVDVLLHPRKIDDLIELAVHLGPGHPQDGPVEVHILAPGQLGVKAGAHLQQAADAPPHLHQPLGGGGDLREDLEEGALAGAVAPDDAQHLALLDLEADVFEGPDALALAVAVVGLADPGIGVGLPAQAGPPAVEVARDRARADHAEIVAFA